MVKITDCGALTVESEGYRWYNSPMKFSQLLRATGLAAVLAVSATLFAASTADAVKTVSWTTSGKNYSCSVTSLAPVLDRTSKYVTISAKVVCNISVSVSISMRAVEMEGSVEDLTNLMDSSTLTDYRATSVVGSKGYTFKYTIRRTCVNTPNDLRDGEEYATKASITVFANGTSYTSQPDRTVPKLNAYAC